MIKNKVKLILRKLVLLLTKTSAGRFLYKILLESGYIEETRLKEHCFYEHKFIDIIIHSKINYTN